jgi:hypothetical protein
VRTRHGFPSRLTHPQRALLRATDTGRNRWIKIETLGRDLVPALDAFTVFAVLDALQRGRNADQLRLASALLRKRHLLSLQGIDARDAANTGLIQFNGGAGLTADITQRLQLCAPFAQAGSVVVFGGLVHSWGA